MTAPATQATSPENSVTIEVSMPATVAMEAYRDLMTGPLPSCDKDFRRAMMLAVLIGRQIESDYRDHETP